MIRVGGETGSAYAGAWLNAGADQLMVAVTDAAMAERIRAAGAQPRVVARSERDLDALKATLDRRAKQATRSIAGWYVEVSTNTLVVVAKSTGQPAARTFVSGSGVPADAVRIEASDWPPKPLFDVRGGDPYFINNQSRCSIGFAVQGGFVTAGHCALGSNTSTTTGFNNVAQGQFRAASFPGDDWGVVTVNANWTPRPFVNNFAGQNLPVAGSQEAPVGASICKFGSTTGLTCGVIQAKNATVNYPEGTVTGLTRTKVCAEGGDSGGSWLSGDQAQGVTSGGSGDCRVGGTTFFQPLSEILQRNGLTLVTTGGSAPPTSPPPSSAPPTTAPPAVACTGFPSTFRGSLPGAGARQIQPDGRFYRTTSRGTQTICLDGPDNADFDVFLQQWNGRSWLTVARSTSPGADEQLSFTGPAGSYRVRVQSNRGSGAYTVGIRVE